MQDRTRDFVAAFASRLRTIRTEKGLSLAQVSEESGLAMSSLSSWERGQNAPTFEGLVALSRGYDVSIHWLVTGLGPRNAKALEPLANERSIATWNVLLRACARTARVTWEFWRSVGPMLQSTAARGSDAERKQAFAVILARSQEIDLLEPPPDRLDEFLQRLHQLLVEFALLESEDGELTIRSAPIEREGFVEEVVRTYRRAEAPQPKLAPSAKKKKRGG